MSREPDPSSVILDCFDGEEDEETMKISKKYHVMVLERTNGNMISR